MSTPSWAQPNPQSTFHHGSGQRRPPPKAGTEPCGLERHIPFRRCMVFSYAYSDGLPLYAVHSDFEYLLWDGRDRYLALIGAASD